MKGLLTLFLLIVLVAICHLGLKAQHQKKSIGIKKIDNPPEIDGRLDEAVWENTAVATDFIQVEPYNGRKSALQTQVRFLYDNEAIYVGALLHDPQPDSIYMELTPRDHIRQDDYFGVYFDPFNDAQRAFGFFVTAAGVQVDMKANINGHEDESWDAVWKSAISINDSSWVVEYMIPYSALRFPKKSPQDWGLNIFRNIQRYRMNTSWDFIDAEERGFLNQQGELKGLRDIKPPLRLSFFPYVSAYTENEPGNSSWSYFYNYGMDLKYGIDESFTLDVTLIPDFGQVQSDDKVVNFTPFEIYYQERRPFFTEGTELFDRNGVFYSRRIGDEPDRYDSVNSTYSEDDIIENPKQTQLINATKLSGKTNGGLGLGFFNAMTDNTYARVWDSAGNEKKVLTQPFTNYNMIVLDQSLKNNSSIAFYNTNVYKGKNERTSNLTGFDFQLRDKKNNYQFQGFINVSQFYKQGMIPETGFKYNASVGKISGNFRYEYSQTVESDTYNPNELGFLRNNNDFNHSAEIEYNIYQPFWKVLNWYNEFDIWYSSLYAPREFTQFGVNFNSRTTFNNYLTVGGDIGLHPVAIYDYFEPRVDGWYYKEAPYGWSNIFFSPDYRKKFVVDVRLAYDYGKKYNRRSYWMNLKPRYRINDKLTVTHNFSYDKDLNDIGYVTDSIFKNQPMIIFGKRDITTITNTTDLSYIFNNKSSLSLRMRHYWVRTTYNQFYDLQKNGELIPNDYLENHDFNFNAFNIDMVYTWNFAPGSEILLVWKNAIYTSDEEIMKNYYNNLRNTLKSPATNSFSVKLMYYLDYHHLKKGISKLI
ncbi:MAG: carbohydrate binding family 9 domain-containing protein [Bacteroidales bacterium]|nr:carbohydrate binding family 9 domain-containing protein [Bacteroidales bacterium]MCF8344222.1 carbohydrate binding family 9 domain-containing protein [Bacteroidales bacterium]MCF8376547.1 carbohydrate binding family 9 domain-containing protein [Bacteroidales bacterium]MCF8400601.1 carbohydrate binding family 9 domain-containing protein [Bacteroidales bacterium]